LSLEFIKDPWWQKLDPDEKNRRIEAGFKIDVESDPEWASLEDWEKLAVRKEYGKLVSQGEAQLAFEKAPEERAWYNQLGSKAARGMVGLAETAGNVLQTADLTPREEETAPSAIDRLGTGIVDWAKDVQQEYDFMKADKAELAGKHGFLRQGIMDTAEYIPQSLPVAATALAGAAIGSAFLPVGGTIAGGAIGGLIGLTGFFGLGTYGREYSSAFEELKRTRPEATDEEIKETSHRVAFRHAALDVGTEIPGTLLGLRMLGGTKVLTQPLKATLLRVMKEPLDETAKKFALATAGEVGGEMIAGGGQAYASQIEGLQAPSIQEAVASSIIPAIGISLFFGAGAAGYNQIQTTRMMHQLNSDNPNTRAKAASIMAYRISENTNDKALGLSWLNQATDSINKGEKFNFDESVVNFAKIKASEDYQAPSSDLLTADEYAKINDAPDLQTALDQFNTILAGPVKTAEDIKFETLEQNAQQNDIGLTLGQLTKLNPEQVADLRDQETELFPGQQVEYAGKRASQPQRVFLIDQNEDGTWNAKTKDGSLIKVNPDKALPVDILEPGREIQYQTRKGMLQAVLIEPLNSKQWKAKDLRNGAPITANIENITPIPLPGERFERDAGAIRGNAGQVLPGATGAVEENAQETAGAQGSTGTLVQQRTDQGGENLLEQNREEPEGIVEVLNDLNPTGGVFKDYTPEKRATMPLGENITTLDKTMGKPPEETVTVYRGGQGEIVPGDYVTTNKQLAQDYAGAGPIIEKKVKLSEVLDDKTEPLGEEYIYRPPADLAAQAEGKESAVGPILEGGDLNGQVQTETPVKPVIPEKEINRSEWKSMYPGLPENVYENLSGTSPTQISQEEKDALTLLRTKGGNTEAAAKQLWGEDLSKAPPRIREAFKPAEIKETEKRVVPWESKTVNGMTILSTPIENDTVIIKETPTKGKNKFVVYKESEGKRFGTAPTIEEAKVVAESIIPEAPVEAPAAEGTNITEETPTGTPTEARSIEWRKGTSNGMAAYVTDISTEDDKPARVVIRELPTKGLMKFTMDVETAENRVRLGTAATLEEAQSKVASTLIMPAQEEIAAQPALKGIAIEPAAKSLLKEYEGPGGYYAMKVPTPEGGMGTHLSLQKTGQTVRIEKPLVVDSAEWQKNQLTGNELAFSLVDKGYDSVVITKNGKPDQVISIREFTPEYHHEENVKYIKAQRAAGKIDAEVEAEAIERSRLVNETYRTGTKFEIDNDTEWDYHHKHKLRFSPRVDKDGNQNDDYKFLIQYGYTEGEINGREFSVEGETVRNSDYSKQGQTHRQSVRLYRGAGRRVVLHESLHVLDTAGLLVPPQSGRHTESTIWEITDRIFKNKEPLENFLNEKGKALNEQTRISKSPERPGEAQRQAPAGTRQEAVRKPTGRQYAVTGSQITAPAESYDRGVNSKGNVWVRQSPDESNSGRQLLIQFSTELINKNAVPDSSTAYYDRLYSGARKGYARLRDFWEIPQWMGYVSRYLPRADVYVVRDMKEAKQFLDNAGYERIIFSAIDVNTALIKDLAGKFKGKVDIGGYTTPGTFDDLKNAKWHENLESLAKDMGVPFTEGVDYRHFQNSKVIPRLTMSQGCLHKCAFCTVPKKLLQTSTEVIDQQAQAFGALDAKLVYLNDKTFGQAKNYTHLENVYNAMKKNNPEFEGFIIQTTGSQLLKMDDGWLQRSGIKYVELGVETYNDFILKALHKPHTEAILERAAEKLRKNNIKLVPNIIIGIKEETSETYQRTLGFLERHKDIISHENIYNLALYEGTEMAKNLKATTEEDLNENVVEKSFHEKPEIHREYSEKFYEKGMESLESGTYAITGFYSQMERALQKNLPNKGDANQFRAMLASWAQKGEFKADELKWSGLDVWLSEQKGKVDKQDVLNYLKANNVELEEVVKREPSEEEIDIFLDDEAGEGYTRDEAREYLSGEEGRPKYAQWQIPGGKNYREVLLTLPVGKLAGASQDIVDQAVNDIREVLARSNSLTDEAEDVIDKWWKNPTEENSREVYDVTGEDTDAYTKSDHVLANVKNQYRGPHWDEPNVVAHTRVGDYTSSEGESVLLLNDNQSDWHQQGRKEGYNDQIPTDEEIIKFYNIKNLKEINLSEYRRHYMASKVPPGPFSKTWHELIMKRMLRHAAENGYQRLAWVTGEQAADMFDLRKFIDRIEYEKIYDEDAPFEIGEEGFINKYEFIAYDKNKNEAIHEDGIDLKRIEELVGKEIAQKIKDDKGTPVKERPYRSWKALSGLDLVVGSEGMKGFYDKILVDFMNKYGKKWGVKVEDTRLAYSKEGGFKMGEVVHTSTGWWGVKYREEDGSKNAKYFKTRTEAEEFSKTVEKEYTTVHSVPITPAMIESVMQGQPLYGVTKRLIGARIYEGSMKPPAKVNLVRSIAKYLSDESAKEGVIDHRTATARQNRVVEKTLIDFLQTSLKKNPEALSWYRGDLERTMRILKEIHPELSKPENRFRMVLALAITSQGNKNVANVLLANESYTNWKNNKEMLVPISAGERIHIERNLEFADTIATKFKNDKAFEKWLMETAPLEDTIREIQRMFGATYAEAKSLVGSSEKIDSVVPRAVIFGPKIGAFFSNLNGDFNPITMDMWFMRTFGRITGTLTRPENIQERKDRFQEALDNSPKGVALAKIEPGLFGTDLEEAAKIISRKSGDEDFRNRLNKVKGGDELRMAANLLTDELKGASLIEAPESGAHRQWLRDRINNVRLAMGNKYENADIQAAIWIGEKELYHEFGAKQTNGDYYSKGAEALYERILGRSFGEPGRAAGRVGQRDRGGEGQIPLFAITGTTEKIYQLVKENPAGVTIDVSTGEVVKHGWVVSPSKRTETPLDRLTAESIDDFLEKFKPIFEADERAFFGSWYADDKESPNYGKYVLDVSYVVDNKTDAAYIGELGGQDGIFNIDGKEYVRTADAIAELKESGLYDEGKRAELGRIQEELHRRLPEGGNAGGRGPEGVSGPIYGITKSEKRRVTELLAKDPSFASPKDFKNRSITLTHWSNQPDIKETDPLKHGTGRTGAEKEVKSLFPELWIPKTYAGYGKYKMEMSLGAYRYGINIDGNKIYDAEKDPLNLFPSAEEVRKQGYYTNQARGLIYEGRIKELGFKGFASTSYQVVSLFNKEKAFKLPVSNKVAKNEPVHYAIEAVYRNLNIPEGPAPTKLSRKGTLAEITVRTANEIMKWPKSVTGPDGGRVLLQYGERGGSRFKHLTKFKPDYEVFQMDKVEWLPNVPVTIEKADVKLLDKDTKNHLYVKDYQGKRHIVVVDPRGRIDHAVYDSGLITQYPPNKEGEAAIANFPILWPEQAIGAGKIQASPTPLPPARTPDKQEAFNDATLTETETLVKGKKQKNISPQFAVTPEFKKWFKGSKIVDENGDPLVMYHGTRTAPARFKNISGMFGHFGTLEAAQDKIRFDKEELGKRGYPSIMPVYLKIEKPVRMSDVHFDEAGSMAGDLLKRGDLSLDDIYDIDPDFELNEEESFVVFSDNVLGGKNGDARVISWIVDKLKEKGYDGIVYENRIESPGEDTYIPFSPTQIKSIYNKGDWDAENPDIRYAVTPVVFSDTVGPVTEEDIKENRILSKKRVLPKLNVKTATGEVSRLLAPISTRLYNIAPELAAKVRRLDMATGLSIKEYGEMLLPLLKKAKGMTESDAADWDYARKNSHTELINELVSKYKMEKEYALARQMFDKLRQAAIDVGLDIGEIEEYWTRKVSDLEGLYKEMNREETGIYTKALEERAHALNINVDQLDPDLRATLISNIILGGPGGPGGSQLTKERKFRKIPPRLNKYYMNSDVAAMEHVYQMVNAIEKRKFFGKIPEKVAETRRQLYVAQAKVREWEGRVRTAEGNEVAKARNKLFEWDGEVRLLESQLWKYSLQRDYTDNIGAFIFEQITNGNIKASQQNEVNEILQARFQERGTHGFWQLYKNFSYIDTMGSLISAITQIGDLAWAMYEGGMITGLKHAGLALVGKSKITREDLGIVQISEEFSDATKMGKAVAFVFKWTGLTKMDAIGKEALLNTALEKYQKRARNDSEKLAEEIRYIFGDETQDTIEALKDGEITDNVKMLVYSRLADFQPIGLSEMPQGYLTAGNGRVFYMLKTFTIKQFDVFRRECFSKMASSEKSERIEGLKNLIRLGALFVLANATADEIKDFILGRKTDFSDRVADNLLRLVGASKFITWTARTEGIGMALSKQILPPFKFIDSASKDIINAGDDKGLETTASIPLLGKLAYWHMGRGTTKRRDIWDIRLSKYRQSLSDVNEDYEKAVDKQSFMRDHREELGSYRRLNAFQSEINNYRKIINQLKSRPEQTDSTRKRIEQLETRRTERIKQFLEKEKS